MAKIQGGIIKISGTIGDMVFVNSKAYEPHLRARPTAKVTKKRKAALAVHNKRSKHLNNLASQLNAVMRIYSRNFKANKFYHTVLSKFRKKEPLDNRFLLLRRLNGMEVNPDYPSNKLGRSIATVAAIKNKLVATLTLTSHPHVAKHKADGYRYDVIMVTWTKTGKSYRHFHQKTNWIKLNDALGEYEFTFSKPVGAVHWMLCLRQRLGYKEIEVESFEAESMHVAAVGTLDKKDEQLLNKKQKEEEAERKRKVKKPEENVVIVWPKKKN